MLPKKGDGIYSRYEKGPNDYPFCDVAFIALIFVYQKRFDFHGGKVQRLGLPCCVHVACLIHQLALNQFVDP